MKMTKIKPLFKTHVTFDMDDLCRVYTQPRIGNLFFAERSDIPVPGEGVTITTLGVAFDDVEPKEVYTVLNFLKPLMGYQERGYSPDEFLTCSCGIGGCAGYHDGVHISIKQNTVTWKADPRMGYSRGVIGTGPRSISFNKKEYNAVKEEFMKAFRKNPKGVFKTNDILFTGYYGLVAFK